MKRDEINISMSTVLKQNEIRVQRILWHSFSNFNNGY